MDLPELINAARGNRTYRDLERLSQRTEQPLSYGRWHQLGSGKPGLRNFPDPPTIRAIADTLGVPQRAVVQAAAESLGLDMADRTNPISALLPPDSADLSDRQITAVLAVVQAFLDPGLAQEQADLNRFVLPDVTSPEPPHEPSAGDRTRPGSASGHGQ